MSDDLTYDELLRVAGGTGPALEALIAYVDWDDLPPRWVISIEPSALTVGGEGFPTRGAAVDALEEWAKGRGLTMNTGLFLLSQAVQA